MGALVSTGASSASAAANVTVMAQTQRMSDPSLTSTQSGTYALGQVISVVCYQRGQSVKGYYSPWLPNGGWDDLWYLVSDGYFAADVDLNTGSNAPVTPACPILFSSSPTPTIAGTAKDGQTLTVQPGTWSPDATLGYQWKIAGQVVATSASWRIPTGTAGKSVTVAVTGSRKGYVTITRESAAVVPSPLTLTAPIPSVAGTFTVGETLTAKPGVWGPTPVTLTYRWLRDGASITGATASTFKLTSTDAGKAISVRVTGSKSGYPTVTKTSTSKRVGKSLTATPAPTVDGTGRVGQTLTASAGNWAPLPITLSYAWYRSGTVISGATAKTYKLATSDAGKTITARVTGRKSGYTSVTKTSAGKSIEKLLTAATPTTSGTPTVGQTLTAAAGSWGPSPVTVRYQWLRDGSAISGATAKTYKLPSASASHKISVKVTVSKQGYTTTSRTSSPRTIGKGFSASPTPTIGGTAREGQRLTASPGTWGPAPVTLRYQWYRDTSAISGATATTYLLTTSDVGKSITVRVTGTKSGYTTVTKVSAPLTPAGLKITGTTPTISGTARAGSTLTANTGTWGPAPVNFSYQWKVNGSAVGGATGSTFTVPVWAATTTVTVTVTGAKSGYASVSFTSAGVGVTGVVGSGVAVNNTMPPGSSLVSNNGQYSFQVQTDGNLVVYKGGSALWSSKTGGQPIRDFVIQGDGNLVMYRTNGTAGWASGTNGKAITALIMQDDGNLVLVNGSTPVWATNTSQGSGGSGGSGDGRLIVPFAPGQTWYVCQGYNGSISHGSDPALDLTSVAGSNGPTGCRGDANGAAGKAVYAPAGGYLINLNNGIGGACLNITGGGSLYLGHMRNIRANGNVNQGDQIGTVGAADANFNGGYAHLHLSARSGTGCGGTKVPFTSAHNMKIRGVQELPYSGATNQWSGLSVVR